MALVANHGVFAAYIHALSFFLVLMLCGDLVARRVRGMYWKCALSIVTISVMDVLMCSAATGRWEHAVFAFALICLFIAVFSADHLRTARHYHLIAIMFDNSPNCVALFDREGKFVSISQSGRTLLGLESADLEKISFTSLWPKVKEQMMQEGMQRALCGKASRFDSPFISKDGTPLTFNIMLAPMRHQERNLPLFVFSACDVTSQRQMERALCESEERYRLMAENAMDVIWSMDENRQFTYLSSSTVDMIGYTPEEMLALSPEEYIVHEYVDPWNEALSLLISKLHSSEYDPGEESKTLTAERQMICKDGSHIWTEARFRLIPASSTLPAQILGVTRDISARKQAEESIKEISRWQEAILNNIPDSAWLKDEDGRYIAVNEPFGLSCAKLPSEIVGRTDFELWPKPLADEYRNEDLHVMKSGKREHTEEPSPDPFGDLIWTEKIITPVYDDNGKIIGITGVSRDRTKSKLMELALRQSEGRLRDLVESMSDWIWETDVEGRFTYLSGNIGTGMGYKPDDLIGRSPFDFFIDEDRDRIRDMMAGIVERREPFRNIEHWFIKRDSSRICVLSSGTPRFSEYGDYLGYRGVNTDITARKLVEEQFASLNDCFISFGSDPDENVGRLVDLFGQLLGTASALYRRVDGDQLPIVSGWNLPPDFETTHMDGSALATQLVAGDSDDVLVINNLSQSKYAVAGSDMAGTEWKTYLGRLVRHGSQPIGVLGAVFFDDAVISDPHKKLMGIIASAIGVEESRRRSNQLLALEKERLQITLRSIGDAVIAVDTDGRVVMMSASAEQLTGWSEEDAKGLQLANVFRIVSEGTWDLAESPFTQVLRTGEVVELGNHTALIARDGKLISISNSAAPIRDINGTMVGVVLVFRDVTDRKRAEDAIRRSEERYRGLVEQASDGIVVVDTDWVIAEANPSACEMLGCTRDEVIGRTLLSLSAREDTGLPLNLLDSMRSDVLSREWLLARKDGSTFNAEINSNRLSDGRFQGIIRDVTTRKTAEKRIAKLNECLLNFGPDPDANIHSLVTVCGELLEADHAFYCHNSSGIWSIPEAWNVPDGLDPHAIMDALSPSSDRDVTDSLQSDDLQDMTFGSGYQERSYVFHPIRSGKELVGAIFVARDPERRQSLDDEKLLGIIASAISVEEQRKMASEELREERDRAQTYLNVAGVIIVGLDAEERVILMNRKGCSVLGYTEEEVIGKNWFENFFAADDDISTMRAAYSTAIQGNLSPDEYLESMVLTRSGKERRVIWHSAVLKDDAGETAGLIMSGEDITDLQFVKDEYVRLAAAVEQAVETIIITDNEKYIIYVNPAFERATGYSRDEAIGEHLSILNGDREGPRINEGLLATIDKGESWSGRLISKKKDGTMYPEEATITPLRDAAGEIVNFVSVRRDVSQEMTMETQLRQAQKLESIGQLAAGIAHEINTPMQYVGDNARFLQDSFSGLISLVNRYVEVIASAKDGTLMPEAIEQSEVMIADADVPYLAEEIPEAIKQSLEGIERVTKIVRAMKEFSHPGREAKTLTDINKAIESTITVCRNEWKYVAEMETALDSDLLPVSCLPGELNQVILNLIVNASHAIAAVVGDGSKGKGLIKVSTSQNDDWVEIRVADTGSGIPEDIRGRVFDPFFTTKAVGRGTGQGLSVARSVVVEKHGGTIDFETEVGKGTTFVVRLPREEQAAALK